MQQEEKSDEGEKEVRMRRGESEDKREDMREQGGREVASSNFILELWTCN